MTDKPEAGKIYALTSDGSTPSIANGDTWAESEVKSEAEAETKEGKTSELIARLMAATETPDDLSQEDIDSLLEDALDAVRLMTRLMAAIETPDDLTQEDINCLLEDAHMVLQEFPGSVLNDKGDYMKYENHSR